MYDNDIEAQKPLLPKKRSPYLSSTIVFTVSSAVSLVMSIISCYDDGFTTANVGGLVGNALYTIAYVMYVNAEIKSQSEGSLPLLSSGNDRHL